MSPPEELHWFNAEVKPYEPALRAYLHKRFPVLPDHDDVVQEAYTRIIHAHRHGRLTSVKSLLFTIARNLAIDMFRRQRRRLQHQQSAAEPIVSDESTDIVAVLERQHRRAVLVDAIALLPERCRDVMVLRHLEGLSYDEIAGRLGIAPNTVKVQLVKGVRLCTIYFRRNGLIEAASAETREVDA